MPLVCQYLAGSLRNSEDQPAREKEGSRMSKKDFIALANAIREHNKTGDAFTPSQLATLAVFCRQQNPDFKRERWLDYIAGLCGPNGGSL
jgi:hypothetical protein